MAEQEPRTAVVIGAGIVRTCTALALQKKGFSVTVVDPEGPYEGASYGNAGVISPGLACLSPYQAFGRMYPAGYLTHKGP